LQPQPASQTDRNSLRSSHPSRSQTNPVQSQHPGNSFQQSVNSFQLSVNSKRDSNANAQDLPPAFHILKEWGSYILEVKRKQDYV
jgi:hypothetical protein